MSNRHINKIKVYVEILKGTSSLCFLIVYLKKESARLFSGFLFLQEGGTMETKSVWVYMWIFRWLVCQM